MEVGLAIVALAVASAVSMLALARFAPRAPPPDLATVLTGNTADGHPWTLDPDRRHPEHTTWTWRCGMTGDSPVAAWRGDRSNWDRAAHESTGRPGDLPGEATAVGEWMVAGKAIQDCILVSSAPPGVTALGWGETGWVHAVLPAGVSPAAVVEFAGRLADHLFHTPGSA